MNNPENKSGLTRKTILFIAQKIGFYYKPKILNPLIYTQWHQIPILAAMIALLSGNFLYKSPTRLIVEAQGVGYEVHISLNTYSAIAHLDGGRLFTYLKVSEDALTIFGFAEESEKEIFLKLIGVSGVGAATARMMISHLRPAEIQQAILQNQVKLLEAVKGIGKKTAERIVLELRDKVGTLQVSGTTWAKPNNTPHTEALEALIALGIAKPAAEQAIKKVEASEADAQSVETIIKLALKSL